MRLMCRPWVIVAGLFCSIVSTAFAEQAMPRDVLVLDDSGGAAAGPFYANIVSALRGSVNRDPSNQYSIFVEHLDLHRFRGPEYELGLQRFFVTKYKDRPLGVIVAVGAGALQYVLRSREELWPTVPVVFTFVDPQYLSALPADVTGTTFRLKLFDMIAAGRVVVPDLNGIALVGDPLKTLVPYRHMQDEIPAVTATGLQIIDLTGMPMREVRARVANLPARTAIIYPGMYSDGEGTYLTPVEGLRRFADAANRPIVVTAETQLGPGIGGYIAMPSEIGQATAVQVLRILQGEQAAAIPISEGNYIKPVFDWRQLQRWGISESTLPPGSEIKFREPTAWEQYRMQLLAICAVLLGQAALIGWLFYEHRRRHLAEAVARNSMMELTHMNRVATAGELSASIAHEVNQPLTGIVTRAAAARRWLAAERPDIDKARAALDHIEAAGHRASDIVKNVRSMFRKDTQDKSRVDINKLIREVLGLVHIDLRKHQIELQSELNDQLPSVLGNQVQLQQVIMNLVMNAIDSMRSAQLRVLTVRSKLNGRDVVQVSIEDTGVGIDPSNRDKVFKPLFTTKEHGMGMGLAICHSIIEGHEGKIWITAGKSGGTVFHVELPTTAG